MYKLSVRGTRGEHSETEGGVYDISVIKEEWT